MWHAQQRHDHMVAQQLRLRACIAIRLRAHLAHNAEMHVDRTDVGGAPQSDCSAAHLHETILVINQPYNKNQEKCMCVSRNEKTHVYLCRALHARRSGQPRGQVPQYRIGRHHVGIQPPMLSLEECAVAGRPPHAHQISDQDPVGARVIVKQRLEVERGRRDSGAPVLFSRTKAQPFKNRMWRRMEIEKLCVRTRSATRQCSSTRQDTAREAAMATPFNLNTF